MRQVALVDRLDQSSVRVDCLFLKVAYKSVAERWKQHVSERVRVEENTLCRDDRESLQNARLSQVKEEEQVHTLVLRLLQQVIYPSVVPLKFSQTF